MDGLTFNPINEYVTVRPDPLEDRIGSIFVPDVDKAHHQHDGVLTSGTVVAVGKGDLIRKGPRSGGYKPVGVQPGQRILYPRHQLVPVLEDGCHVLHQQHIFCILEAE